MACKRLGTLCDRLKLGWKQSNPAILEGDHAMVANKRLSAPPGGYPNHLAE